MEISRRLQIDNVFGAPLPGKFMVGFGDPAADAEEVVYLDVFEGGRILDHRETRREVRSLTGSAPADASFGPASGRDIAVRMLRNLVGIEMNRRQSPERAADYLEMLLAVDPEAAQERFQRALLRIQGEDVSGAKEDIDWLLDRRPPGIDYDRLESFRDSLPEI